MSSHPARTTPRRFGAHLSLAIRSRGLEAPIAFHVANNTFTAVLNALLAGGGDFSVARSTGAGGPHLLIPALFVLTLVIVVWRREGKTGEPTMTNTSHVSEAR